MKKFLISAAVIFTLLFYGAAVIEFSDRRNSAGADSNQTPAAQTVKYTVKEYRGKIAVFVGNEDIPVKVLDIDTNGLREYDRAQFEKGITLDSMRDVLLLEEDFSG